MTLINGRKTTALLPEEGHELLAPVPRERTSPCITSVVAVLSLGGLILFGCAIGSVGDRVGSKFKYWYALTKPIVTDGLQFEDNRIFIQFRIDESFVNFRLQNVSDRPVSILWDRMTLAVDGRITPFKYSADGYALQPVQRLPTVIPPSAYLIDFIVPAENLQLIDGSWRERDLIPTRDRGGQELRTKILGNVGRTVSMYLPLASSEQVLEYLFEFEVSSVEKVDWKNYRPPRRTLMPRPSGPSAGETWTTAVLIGVFVVAAVYFVFIRKPTPEE